MNSKNFGALLIFIVAIAVLVVAVSFRFRGYQDSWILEDVTLVTIVYVIAFSVFASVCDDNRILAIGCVFFLIFLNAIPNLKYDFFQNPFDSVAHYGYARNLVLLGHVPQSGFYAPLYQDFPGMHIFIGLLSIISGLSVNDSIKLFSSMIIAIIPLMTYFATRRIFKPDIQRFIIIGSGLPTFVSYYIGGTTFGIAFYFSLVCLILASLVTTNKRRYALILLLFVFGLLFSHAMTTLYFISFLVIATILWKLLPLKENRVQTSRHETHILTATIIILTVLFAARLAFESGTVLEIFTDAGARILNNPGSGILPTTLFQLPFSATVIFFFLTYASVAVIMLLSFAGVIVFFLKLRRENNETYKKFYVFLLCLLSAILALFAFQFISGYSATGYKRFIDYALVLSPFLSGLFLWHFHKYFNKRRFGSAAVAILVFLCISVSLISIFPYQPLAPTANVMSPDLPADEYIFDYRGVNTVYQESMILFAQSFSTNNSRVACDTVTRWQIYGFANNAFIDRSVYYNPLETPNSDWDLFLLHYDGKAGSLIERVENRTREVLTGFKETLGNVVYDNGESFIIAK